MGQIIFSEMFIRMPVFTSDEQFIYWDGGISFIGNRNKRIRLDLYNEENQAYSLDLKFDDNKIELPEDFVDGEYTYSIVLESEKPYTGSSSGTSTSSSSSSYSVKSSSGSTSQSNTSQSSTSSSGSSSSSYNSKSYTTDKTSYSSDTKKGITTKKSTYDSYDDGYDDIYMDGDYDYDRYDRDSDYADGVDDAMDEEEDW